MTKYIRFAAGLISSACLSFTIPSYAQEDSTCEYQLARLIESSNWPPKSASHFHLDQYPVSQDKRFKSMILPYFKSRGVMDKDLVKRLITLDLKNIDQALDAIFYPTHPSIASAFIKNLPFNIKLSSTNIEHVGRELFGPLNFYLQLLSEQSESMGLTHDLYPQGKGVTKDGNFVFPSVQVVKSLRYHDPNVKGVTIGRIYFTKNKYRAGLELFQASSLNNQQPQDISFTLQRMISLIISPEKLKTWRSLPGSNHCKLTLPEPVDHIAVMLPSKRSIYTIHQAAKHIDSPNLKLYLDKVAFNPNDKSTNTKIAVRASYSGAPFNKIIEFVHYGN